MADVVRPTGERSPDADLDAYVAALVDQAPPIGPAKLDELAVILGYAPVSPAMTVETEAA